MTAPRLFWCLLKWDLLREIRRKEAVINMTLFAVLILFLVDLALGPLFEAHRNHPEPLLAGLESRVGPVVFWIAVLFAGTVGLSQSFAADRERGALEGILLAPLDAGIFYLAKVAATWTYVMIMEAILVLVYCPLFNLSELARLPPLFAALGVFTLGYMAAGVLLAAMTTSLRRGGEVVLRILLFPLLLPVIYLTLRSQAATFGVDVAAGALGPCLSLPAYAVMVLAFDVIYLLAGFLIFPKVVEE